jgi:hypothetical protein
MSEQLKLKGKSRPSEFPKNFRGKSEYKTLLGKAPDATPYRYVFYRYDKAFKVYGMSKKQNGEVITSKHVKKMNKYFSGTCPHWRKEGPVCAVVCGAFLAMTIILIPLTIWIIFWFERKQKEIWISGEEEIRKAVIEMNRDVFSKKGCRLVAGREGKGLFLVLYLDFLAEQHGVPLEMDVESGWMPQQPNINPYANLQMQHG